MKSIKDGVWEGSEVGGIEFETSENEIISGWTWTKTGEPQQK